MKKQALSIYQMLKLKELGVDTSKSSMVRILTDEDGNTVSWGDITWMDNRWVILDYDNKVYELYEDIYDVDGSYDHSYTEECGVFTLQDIIEMLPKSIYTQHIYEPVLAVVRGEFNVAYFDHTEGEVLYSCKHINPLQAAYDMLVWAAERGYMKGGENE